MGSRLEKEATANRYKQEGTAHHCNGAVCWAILTGLEAKSSKAQYGWSSEASMLLRSFDETFEETDAVDEDDSSAVLATM